MPAELYPPERITELAELVAPSPAMTQALRWLRGAGFVLNRPGLGTPARAALQRLSELGLTDPGFSGEGREEPYIWVSNGNGERVLKHVEGATVGASVTARLLLHPRAHSALAALPEVDQLNILATVGTLQGSEPSDWPTGTVQELSADKREYLVSIPPNWRAFVRSLDTGAVELFDILSEDTLRQFLERAGSKAG